MGTVKGGWEGSEENEGPRPKGWGRLYVGHHENDVKWNKTSTGGGERKWMWKRERWCGMGDLQLVGAVWTVPCIVGVFIIGWVCFCFHGAKEQHRTDRIKEEWEREKVCIFRVRNTVRASSLRIRGFLGGFNGGDMPKLNQAAILLASSCHTRSQRYLLLFLSLSLSS